MSNFKFGDPVKVNGTDARIVSIWMNVSGDFICKVEFGDGSTAEYPENHIRPRVVPKSIKPASSARPTNSYGSTPNKVPEYLHRGFSYTREYSKDTNCPVCKELWQIMPSPFRGKKEMWYDCLKCKMTREQVEEMLKDEF